MHLRSSLLALFLVTGSLVAAAQVPNAQYRKLSTAQALAKAPSFDKSLTPLARSLAASEKAMKQHPGAASKRAVADSAYAYAHKLMYLGQGKMPQAVQYRAALACYRKVLAVDPHHAAALKEKKVLDDIYRTMPGGIPK